MTSPVPPQVLSLLEPLTFKSMYDLGNKKTDGVPYNSYFRSLGITYDSIDLNGMDGALPLDLNADIELAARELVSNLGTSEHVLNQEACFRNVHNLSERRMVHWVPLAKRHPRHGLYRLLGGLLHRSGRSQRLRDQQAVYRDVLQIVEAGLLQPDEEVSTRLRLARRLVPDGESVR